MKNKKWLNYTVGILLTFIVLTAVAGAGVRAGMMQNIPFARHMRDMPPPMMQNGERFTQENPSPQGNSQDNTNPQAPQGNPNPKEMRGGFQGNDFERRMFDNDRGFDRRDGGFSFLTPVFGLVRLAVLALLVWLGYKLIKNSGWRLSLNKTTTAPTPAPVTESAAAEEQKEAK